MQNEERGKGLKVDRAHLKRAFLRLLGFLWMCGIALAESFSTLFLRLRKR